MDYRKSLFGLIVLVSAIGSAYGQAEAVMTPPPGYSGSGTNRSYSRAAANAADWVNKTVRTTASLNVGGRAVQIPFSMRLSANAPRFIAAAVMLNPALRVGAAVGSWLLGAGLVYSVADGLWHRYTDSETSVTDAVWNIHREMGCAGGYALVDEQHKTLEYIGARIAAGANSSCTLNSYSLGTVNPITGVIQIQCTPGATGGSCGFEVSAIKDTGPAPDACPTGWTATDQGCVNNLPVTPTEFEEALINKPMPLEVPNEMPLEMPLPVDKPLFNPDPAGRPQPYVIPVGEPTPVPFTDPELWRNPTVKVTPKPGLDPWLVDLTPEDVLKLDPSPVPQSSSDPSTMPAPKASDIPDLCVDHPEIIACQQLNFDTPPPDQIQTKDKEISIAPDSGWGGGGGSCPAPRHLSVANADFTFQPYCDFFSGIRPVVVALAWLGAAMILMGARGGAAE